MKIKYKDCIIDKNEIFKLSKVGELTLVTDAINELDNFLSLTAAAR